MNGAALDRVFRAASSHIVGALAARFRDLDLAEDAFAEACARACAAWPAEGPPANPPAWLFQVAQRVALDAIRRRRTRERWAPDPVPPPPTAEDELSSDNHAMPDVRLRLIFICCHPAVAPESRAALTLRLVCGLSVPEIARAFLLSESAVAQRLVRAKHKISAAGVPFALPDRAHWPERLEAVLSTLEVAYAKAHEDAAGTGPHAGYAAEMLHLTRALVELVPEAPEAKALAAIVHYAEARRTARTNAQGTMTPLSRQDPTRWRGDLIAVADALLADALDSDLLTPRVLQAQLQAAWCRRRSLADPEPWPQVLALYDQLLQVRDDPVVRLNRAVALAAVSGPHAGLAAIAELDSNALAAFAAYHAVRGDLLAQAGDRAGAREAYDRLLALDPPAAERAWLEAQRRAL